MTYISLVPEAPTLRKRIATAWGILRGRYSIERFGLAESIQKYAEYVVEVSFEGGVTVLQEWFDGDLDDTANMIFLARHAAKHSDGEGNGPDLFDTRVRTLRAIRRSDWAVFHLLGERVPDAFSI
ncbi:hypothetical protein SEA_PAULODIABOLI_326 [Microbacterium phage PauloDiaboli]|nr:hypothetical protein SEA_PAULODIABOLI_326 [Microbacterium phage PauloDiaboli]